MNAPSSPDATRLPLSQARIPDEVFAQMRRDNLARWPTVAEVDFAQALERHRSLPPHKQLAWVMRRAVAEQRCLTQPRGGCGTFELHRQLMQILDREGLADIIPTTTDSYTRNEQFNLAQKGVEEGIRNYQYLDRLAALYHEHGVELHRRQPGFLTGTNIPPSIAIIVCVLDCLLAAEQGVRNYGLELGQTLHLIQDAAAIQACGDLCQEYLRRRGFDDIFTPVTSLHWMGAWPQDDAQCAALVAYGGTLAAIGGAVSVTTKSTHEAFGIPTPNRFVKSRVMPARDADGYLRILDPAFMPFPQEVLQIDAEKLGRRAQREGVAFGPDLAAQSVYEISEPIAKLLSDKWPRQLHRKAIFRTPFQRVCPAQPRGG